MLKWYELSIETNSMAVDAISEFLVMNGASGIAVHDPFEYQYLLETQNKNLLMGDFKRLEECVILKAYFSALNNKINIKPKLQDEENPFIEFEYQLYDFANRKDEYLTVDELEKFIADKLTEMKSYLDPSPEPCPCKLLKKKTGLMTGKNIIRLYIFQIRFWSAQVGKMLNLKMDKSYLSLILVLLLGREVTKLLFFVCKLLVNI